MATTATLMTAEEFLADPRYEGWELIDGEPREVCMGMLANVVGAEVIFAMVVAKRSDGGVVVNSEQRYKLWPDRPNHIRKADASYFAPGRVPDLGLGESATPPDLAVEVVSTHEDAQDTEAKRVDYLNAGVRLLWVLYPLTRTVHVYGQGGLVDILSEGDTLTGRDVLPSFAVPVASLFPKA